MRSKAEVTTRYAKAYVNARKKDKGRVLDEVVSVTGWSRDNARRRLTAAAAQRPGSGRVVAVVPRKPRAQGYSYDARKVLQRVWAASGGQCGKYLAASMRAQLDALERHGELVPEIARPGLEDQLHLATVQAGVVNADLGKAVAQHGLRYTPDPGSRDTSSIGGRRRRVASTTTARVPSDPTSSRVRSSGTASRLSLPASIFAKSRVSSMIPCSSAPDSRKLPSIGVFALAISHSNSVGSRAPAQRAHHGAIDGVVPPCGVGALVRFDARSEAARKSHPVACDGRPPIGIRRAGEASASSVPCPRRRLLRDVLDKTVEAAPIGIGPLRINFSIARRVDQPFHHLVPGLPIQSGNDEVRVERGRALQDLDVFGIEQAEPFLVGADHRLEIADALSLLPLAMFGASKSHEQQPATTTTHLVDGVPKDLHPSSGKAVRTCDRHRSGRTVHNDIRTGCRRMTCPD